MKIKVFIGAIVAILVVGALSFTFVTKSDIRVEFIGPVSEQDKAAVNKSVEIARALFENRKFPEGTELYVAGDESSYIEQHLKIIGGSVEEAQESFSDNRGITNPNNMKALINLPAHDNFTDGSRNYGIIFTTVHEFYHILQVHLSGDPSLIHDESGWVVEVSANTGALRAITGYFCQSFVKISGSAEVLAPPTECTDEFVYDDLKHYAEYDFLSTNTVGAAMALYVYEEFGIYAFDKLYIILSKEAENYTEYNDRTRSKIWTKAMQKTFNVSNFERLGSKAVTYVNQNAEAIENSLETYFKGLQP